MTSISPTRPETRWLHRTELALGTVLLLYALFLFASPRAPSRSQISQALELLRRDHIVEGWLAATGLLWIVIAATVRRRPNSHAILHALPVVSLALLALWVWSWA